MADIIEESKAVYVSNISPLANEKTVSDFFSFCGKISKLFLKKSESNDSLSAIVVFESDSAAKTALLLTNALIVDRPITVTPYVSETTATTSQDPTQEQQHTQQKATVHVDAKVDEDKITQRNFGVPDEQRTKTSVIASMLAAGYVLGSDSLEKAKDYDEKHNISLYAKVAVEQMKVKAHEIDQQYKISEKAEAIKNAAVDKAKEIDTQYQISERAKEAAIGAKTTAVNTAQKLNENPTVHSAVEGVKSTASKVTASVTTMFNDYKEQTQRAIEEKQKAKQHTEGTQPTTEATTQQAQAPTPTPVPTETQPQTTQASNQN